MLMQKKFIRILSILIISLSCFSYCFAQHAAATRNPDLPTNRILFIFDASNSMYGSWQSDRKINIAKRLLIELIDSLAIQPNVQFALRVFGHQKHFPPQDCDDTKLEVPFAHGNKERIKRKLNAIVPKGTTPIAKSLEESVNDFPPCDNCRNIIVLITDGIEECRGDPCEVSQRLQREGIILRPFIIGVGRDFSADFECVGQYFDSSSERLFRTALNVVITQTINPTTLQINLLDVFEKPTETNVNMTFYDHFTGQMKYNFIHTMNPRGVPDTLDVDALTIYDVVVHTIPPVKRDSVRIVPGKHTIVGIDAPQGYLSLGTLGKDNLYRDLQCVVREQGKTETLNIQNFRETTKYLTGKYQLEILCLPRIILDNVEISQSATTEVKIPVPGIASISLPANGFAAVYLEHESGLELIYNMRNNIRQESLVLQPGNYRVIFRSGAATRSFFTAETSFTIKSGETKRVQVRR